MKVNHASWKSDQNRSSIIVQFACWAAAIVLGFWAPIAALAQLSPQAINSTAPLQESPPDSGGFSMARSASAAAISYVITRPGGLSPVTFSRNIPGGATGANFSVRACFVGTPGAQNALFLVSNTTNSTQPVFEPVFFNLSQATPTGRDLFQAPFTFDAPGWAATFFLSNDERFLFTRVVRTVNVGSTMDAREIGVYRTDTGDKICSAQDQINVSLTDSIDAELRDNPPPNGTFDAVRIFRNLHPGTDVDLTTCTLPGSTTAPQPPTITNFNPTSGAIGTNVTVTGTNFTGATALQFNSTNATITSNTGTQITTTVPTGATTGRISVTTAAGTGISTSNFTVLLPTVSFSTADNDATAAEPNSNAFCTLTRTGNPSDPLTVRLGIGGTATNGTDYDQIESTVIIPAGSASTRVTIRTHDDTTAERTETVNVTIQADNTVYNRGAPFTKEMTIEDDETPQISIASNKSTVLEAGTDADRRATLTVTRLGRLSPALDVGFTVSPTTRMVMGTDFSNLTSPIHINEGASSATIFFTAVDDAMDEDNETAIITIQNGTGYTRGSPSFASVTITDNDPSPRIKFADRIFPTQPVRVRLSSVSERDVTVYFNLSSGTASACRDCKPRLSGNPESGVTNVTCHGYVDRGPLPQKRIIPAGSRSVTIDCMVCPGSSGKTFFVNLLKATNATIDSRGVRTCQVTIQ